METEKERLVCGFGENIANGPTKTITLKRQLYTLETFAEKYKDEGTKSSVFENIKKSMRCSKRKAGKILGSYLPIIGFIRSYKLKQYILGDVLSGFTVSFMHLPQAMGFGILASLRPIHGLYSTFFPVLVYLLFGTSPYISFGTNAVMALLTQTVVEREADSFIASFANTNASRPTEDEIMDVKIGASMACCVLVGIFLTGMGLLKLGIITTYLSVSFVGGFTTAAAFHIASSQVPKIFGIKVKTFAGAGKLVLMYIDLFSKITQTKFAEIIIAVICIIVLLLVKICVNERYNTKMKMPIPIDLIVVVIGTIVSHFAKFVDVFGVKIVGEIPSGFTMPALPNFDHASSFVSDAFVMAILSLAMSISMAKLCANKHGLPIDDNQELIAYGASNFVSGFFCCFPSATAPPRTMILSSLGARTTLNAIATSVFFLLVILVIGQLFVSLPLSVLAAMIIVSMKDLLLQYRNLPKIWNVNKYDFIIWVVTNSVSILGDLNYGIIAGVGISIFLTVVQDQLSTGHLIGLSKAEDIALRYTDGKNMREIEGVKIFKIPTNLYFATAERMKFQIFRQILHPKKYLKKFRKLETMAKIVDEETVDVKNNISIENVGNPSFARLYVKLKSLVLDCSMVNYIDMAGIAALQQIIKEYKTVQVDVYFVAITDNVCATLEAGEFFKTFPKSSVFVDVFDAISMINSQDFDSSVS
ncbi:sulfate transporter-like isoform X2 [Mercenaria mercenaria]|uniref:sulfate transporter-like isoform X1 n=1 Tax=Mercenaria mercenaria TaxID=6596 RepID=UPI00234F0A54|nr:sulfate transporter-like isoform X1 [Mercenaria mercenaria]XP_045213599.2 sulfate transporter-like isoform X2 [Mercenaria mercenaria]